MKKFVDATLEEVVDAFSKATNGGEGNSSHGYRPSFNDSMDGEERRDLELKHQELLKAREEGRYLTALNYERELFEKTQANFEAKIEDLKREQEEYEKNIKKKYKDLSIEELIEKKKRARSEKTKKELDETIEALEKIKGLGEEISNIQHQATLNQMEFNRSVRGRNGFTELSKSVGELSDKVVKTYKSIRNFVEPWAKADHAASKFTKTLGGTKAALDAIRKQSLDNVALGFGTKYNMSSEELIQAQSTYLKDIGRNINMSDNAQESMAAIRAVAGDAGLNLATQFENFGVSMVDTGDHIGKMFADASKHGLSFEKYSENVTKNIRIAQNYTFKDGLKGLENMAKKATAIKLDMQQVANFADKVGNIEGAIETAGKLQVLGGPFASMADPLGMLSESLTDMEGFQDRITKLYSQMGYFDKTTGEVKVSAHDKMRLRAYAEATGQDYSSIMETVNTSAKRTEIMNQIKGSKNASGFDDDMKELIANTATFKDGQAGVSIKGKFKTLDELSEKDREVMIQMTQSESEDVKQIAMDLRSLVDKEEGLGKTYDAIQGEIASPFGQLLKWVHGIFDFAMFAIPVLGGISLIKNIGSIGSSIVDLVSTFKGGGGDSSFDFTDLFRKGGSKGVFGRGLGRAGKRGLIKVLGRKGATKVLGAFGKKAATTAASSVASTSATAIGGLLSGAGAAAGGAALYSLGNHLDKKTETAIAEGRMEKGGTKHTLSKTGTSAIKGAGIGLGAAGAAGMVSAGATMLGASALATGIGSALGAIGGPIGMAIGAAVVGGVVGLVKSAKAKNEVIVDNQLKALGVERKGDYRKGHLKKIDKALQTGELSDKMRRKLIQKGDLEIVKEIEKVKEQKEAKKKEKEEIRKIKLETANITIGSANISGIDFSKGFGKRKKVMLGDRIGKGFANISGIDFSKGFDKRRKVTLGDRIDKGISIVKGYKEDGLSGAWEAIRGRRNHSEDNQKDYTNTGNRSFDININGSLKLTGDNGQSVDIIGELRKNPNLLRSLADMISKEIGIIEKGTYVPQRNGK